MNLRTLFGNLNRSFPDSLLILFYLFGFVREASFFPYYRTNLYGGVLWQFRRSFVKSSVFLSHWGLTWFPIAFTVVYRSCLLFQYCPVDNFISLWSMPARPPEEKQPEVFRGELFKRFDGGESVEQLSLESGIPRSTLYRWLRAFRKRLPRVRSLSEKKKLQMIRAVESGEPVAAVCRRFGVSRPTFYKWYRRWKHAPLEEKQQALADRRPRGTNHWKSVPEAHPYLLSIVVRNPSATLDEIVRLLPRRSGKPLLGRHGVHNFLSERGINSIKSRQYWVNRRNDFQQLV
jgi:transposase-like protein